MGTANAKPDSGRKVKSKQAEGDVNDPAMWEINLDPKLPIRAEVSQLQHCRLCISQGRWSRCATSTTSTGARPTSRSSTSSSS